MSETYLGLDLGTTSLKGLCLDAAGRILSRGRVATPWERDAFGGSVLDLAALMAGVRRIMDSLTADLPPGTRVAAIGLAGMAETGVLLDDQGDAVWPAIAWHDPRGADEVAALQTLQPDFAADFVWRTGLPLDAQASFSKACWLSRHVGGGERGRCWLSIPEYVAWALTGQAAAEASLLSRTGFLDHPSDAVWGRALELAGLRPDVVPDRRDSGQAWGVLEAGAAAGAAVTVAGHDHLVAAVGAGVDSPGQLFNSCGTADVVLRLAETWPSRATMAELAALNISLGHHPRPGTYAVNGGTKAGLVLGYLHRLLGDVPEIDLRATAGAGPVEVLLPRLGTDALQLTLHAQCDPADVWAEAFGRLRDQSRRVNEVLQAAFGPNTDVTCGGGWTHVPAVRRLKEAVYGRVAFSQTDEPGCVGAASIAAGRPLRDRTATESVTT